MLEPKVIKLQPPERVPSELEKHYKERHEQKIDRSIAKADDAIDYVNEKLAALIKETLEKIHSDTSPNEIKEILITGDKRWRGFCANARKTMKFVKLDSDAFQSQVHTIIYKSDEIIEAKEKFEKRVRFYNKNWFTRMWFRFVSLFQKSR